MDHLIHPQKNVPDINLQFIICISSYLGHFFEHMTWLQPQRSGEIERTLRKMNFLFSFWPYLLYQYCLRNLVLGFAQWSRIRYCYLLLPWLMCPRVNISPHSHAQCLWRSGFINDDISTRVLAVLRTTIAYAITKHLDCGNESPLPSSEINVFISFVYLQNLAVRYVNEELCST